MATADNPKEMRVVTSAERDAMSDGADQSSGWSEHANCTGKLALFFAPKAERPQARARREAKAKRLCDACPVFDECRQFARQNREYGYWAGENEEDRHLLGFRVSAPIGARVRLARQVDAEERSA